MLVPGESAKMKVPHILKDGADSVGVRGATIRVYINIGTYSQHWLDQHQALLGLTPQKPFSIKAAQENSVYWNATQEKVDNIAKFFRKLTSYRLADAPGGSEFMTKDEAVLTRGKTVFAEECATCHSSKQPPAGVDPEKFFTTEVMKPDFLTANFLSDERRHPVTKIKTNAARAFATERQARTRVELVLVRDLQETRIAGQHRVLESIHGCERNLSDSLGWNRILSHALAHFMLVVRAVLSQQRARKIYRRSVGRRTHGSIQ
jgi:hypothetical protein